MTDTCPASCAEVQNFFTRGDVYIFETTYDPCSQLASKWVPDTIFSFGALYITGYRDSFFAVYGFPWDDILRDK
jgi:hypothetical protein